MMAFAHADHYPVMTDNARMSDDKPVHLAPDLRTDDRHRFRVECQQASDISFFRFHDIGTIHVIFHCRTA